MRASAACLLPLLAAVAACGGAEQPEPVPRVTVRLTAPADAVVVRADSVEVAGRVAPPDAAVTVLGKPAGVAGGTFTARIALEPGANVVDVAATAPGHRAAFAALRIVREIRVQVPDLAGTEADAAVDELEGLGLQAELRRGGGLFDPLLPGDPSVCETQPQAGAEVLPGTTVELVVARSCS